VSLATFAEPGFRLAVAAYGGLDASNLKRLKELEAELSQYKRMYAELAHENCVLKNVIATKL